MESNSPIKILLLLPCCVEENTMEAFSHMVAEHKLPNTEVHIRSLPKTDGALYHIAFRTYEGIVTRGIIRATRQAAQENFDALSICCFYDTALHESREISGNMVVTAPCIAACEIASSLSNRFGVIVGHQKWVNQMRQAIYQYGYRDKLTGFYSVDLGVLDFLADEAETERRILEASRKAIEQDHAEAIILGCTLQVGFYKKLITILGVPVIDSSVAVLKRGEYSAILKRQCGLVPSRMWSCEAPNEKELRESGVFEDEQVFDKCVTIQADACESSSSK